MSYLNYINPDLDHKPEQLAKRGGAHYSDAACETIASIYGNKLSHIVVTTKNNGSVPDLPADCAVEVSSYIGSTGARSYCLWIITTSSKRVVTMHEKTWNYVLKKQL